MPSLLFQLKSATLNRVIPNDRQDDLIQTAQGSCRDCTSIWWNYSFIFFWFTLSGNTALLQPIECTAAWAEICSTAWHNYSAICTMPVHLMHREFRYGHKYINCSSKPFSQINTVSETPLSYPECNTIETGKSQLFINSVIKGPLHTSIFITVALFDISVDSE